MNKKERKMIFMKKKTFMAFTLIVTMMLSIFAGGMKTVKADEGEKLVKLYNDSALAKYKGYNEVYIKGKYKDGKKTKSKMISFTVSKDAEVKMELSNPKIAKIKYDKRREDGNYEYKYIRVIGKKVGTTKFTLTIKEPGQKKIKYSCKIKFFKYKNPFKEFTIESKNFASKLNKKCVPNVTITLSKAQKDVKINVKMKKGFKFKQLYMTSWREVKNNSKIKLESYEKDSFYVTVEYTMNGDPNKTIYGDQIAVKIKRK